MAKDYNPKNVSVIVGGHTVQGYAEGAFVKFAQNEDTYNLTKGSDGEGARAQSSDDSGRMTIMLMQTSESNDVLSALHNAGSQVPCLIRDFNGTTLVSCVTGWVIRNPDIEFSNEITTREFIIESDAWDVLVGGIPA